MSRSSRASNSDARAREPVASLPKRAVTAALCPSVVVCSPAADADRTVGESSDAPLARVAANGCVKGRVCSGGRTAKASDACVVRRASAESSARGG